MRAENGAGLLPQPRMTSGAVESGTCPTVKPSKFEFGHLIPHSGMFLTFLQGGTGNAPMQRYRSVSIPDVFPISFYQVNMISVKKIIVLEKLYTYEIFEFYQCRRSKIEKVALSWPEL